MGYFNHSLWSKMISTVIILTSLMINFTLGSSCDVEVTRSQDGDLINLLGISTPCSFFNAIDAGPALPGFCRCKTTDMVPKAGTFMDKCIYDLPSETRMYFSTLIFDGFCRIQRGK